MDNKDNPVVVVAAKRTPIGSFMGQFKELPAWQLGSEVIRGCLAVTPSHVAIDQVLLGCVLTAGQGQAPARQATLGAGLPPTVGAVTVNKVCGSGMYALMMASDRISLYPDEVILAGGMESMSRAPFLLPQVRAGHKWGALTASDHLQLDGLEDPYQQQLMGFFADETADHYDLSREAQDEFAAQSLLKAQAAVAQQRFVDEMIPVASHTLDERPTQVKVEKIPQLKPAFSPDGTVTAANASAISDGASGLIVMRLRQAESCGLEPLACIRGYTWHAQEPQWFTTAPISAMQALQQRLQWSWDEIDLFEINEAFAVVPLVTQQVLDLPLEKINVHGGACALGHPIGSSGARIVVTLLHALRTHQLKKGMASICIGGGEAMAMALELC